MSRYTGKERYEAIHVPLANYLNSVHPGELEADGMTRYRRTKTHSLKVNIGVAGYNDWGSGAHGNSIDYLVNYMGYSVVEAVKALSKFSHSHTTVKSWCAAPCSSAKRDASFVLPEPSKKRYSQLYAYLTKTRCIPASIVDDLVQRKLLYQAENRPGHYNNIIFASCDKDFYEEHGTNTSRDFHFSKGKNGNESWYFFGDGTTRPNRIYITEASLDAISLYALKKEKDSCYAAIGGAGKQKSIDRLKEIGSSAGIPCIIATDNDEAGDSARARNEDCLTIRPSTHDWNDDLKLTGGISHD